MLPKRRRLSAREVREVLAKGTALRASFLSARHIREAHPLRVSVVVSKKVAKRAVERNRLRRAAYRALSSFEGKGTAVIFVQKIPEGALSPAFRKDLVVLMGN